jgi:hypothetical protein
VIEIDRVRRRHSIVRRQHDFRRKAAHRSRRQRGDDLVQRVDDRIASQQRELYERHGVPEYWIVDPRNRRIEVLRLEGERYVSSMARDSDTLTTLLLDGFTLAVGEVFAA